MGKLIYLADDEPNIRELLRSFLVKEGYDVEAFANGDSLFDAFTETPCDLAVLDIVMPGSSGFAVCSKLRKLSGVPIIMLTARDADDDCVMGISLGGDDYITKPFSPVKLVMRINAMFRRIEMGTESAGRGGGNISLGDIMISAGKRAVCNAGRAGAEIGLTNKEFGLLKKLAENAGKAVSREELLAEIWGYGTVVETRAIDDTVKRLRRKLASITDTVSIGAVWGHGYRLDAARGGPGQ